MKTDVPEARRESPAGNRPERASSLLRLQQLAGNRALATLHSELPIVPPNDPSEAEADAIAAQFGSPAKSGSEPPPAATAPASVHVELRRPGCPLDQSVRSFYEARLGHDLSAVRIHADAESNRSASAVRAQAYTVGRHIVFAAGRFTPHIIEGQRLQARPPGVGPARRRHRQGARAPPQARPIGDGPSSPATDHGQGTRRVDST